MVSAYIVGYDCILVLCLGSGIPCASLGLIPLTQQCGALEHSRKILIKHRSEVLVSCAEMETR